MLHRPKLLHSATDAFSVRPCQARYAYRSQHVFLIVSAFQRNVLHWHDLQLTSVLTPDDASISKKRSILMFALKKIAREPRNACFCARRQLGRDLIVQIQHRPIGGSLILEDPSL